VRQISRAVVSPIRSPLGDGGADWFLAQVGHGMLWGIRPDSGFVTSSGGSVSSVADRSGGGDSLIQNTGLNKPTLTTGWSNGRDAITFPGTRFMVSGAAHCPLESVAYSWGGVFEFTNVAASRCPFALGATACPSYTIESSAHTVRYIGSGTCVGPGTSLTSKNDVVVTRQAGATGVTSLYINGALQTLTPNNLSQGTPSGVLVVGAIDTAKTFGFIGSVAELFIKTGVMTQADVTARRSYTSSRYRI
jgi:hypothetical protein